MDDCILESELPEEIKRNARIMLAELGIYIMVKFVVDQYYRVSWFTSDEITEYDCRGWKMVIFDK